MFKYFCYKFNIIISIENIKWDKFNLINFWDKQILISNQLISKSSWLWYLNAYLLENWNFRKITNEWNNWIIWYDFKNLQNNWQSLWTYKSRIFWFKKWSQYRVYFLKDDWNLERIQNENNNQWYLINWVQNSWTDDQRFICFWRICWTTKWENDFSEMFYIDDDWMLKRLWKDKKIKLFNVNDSVNQFSINYTSSASIQYNWIWLSQWRHIKRSRKFFF